MWQEPLGEEPEAGVQGMCQLPALVLHFCVVSIKLSFFVLLLWCLSSG